MFVCRGVGGPRAGRGGSCRRFRDYSYDLINADCQALFSQMGHLSSVVVCFQWVT